METVQNIANYVAQKFNNQCGQKIDEMKLHKIMYFIQRESLIQTDERDCDRTRNLNLL